MFIVAVALVALFAAQGTVAMQITGDHYLTFKQKASTGEMDVVSNGAAVATEATLGTISTDITTLAAVDYATETTLATLATQTTAASIDTRVSSLVAKDYATETTLATLATQTTAASINTHVSTLAGAVSGGIMQTSSASSVHLTATAVAASTHYPAAGSRSVTAMRQCALHVKCTAWTAGTLTVYAHTGATDADNTLAADIGLTAITPTTAAWTYHPFDCPFQYVSAKTSGDWSATCSIVFTGA